MEHPSLPRPCCQAGNTSAFGEVASGQCMEPGIVLAVVCERIHPDKALILCEDHADFLVDVSESIEFVDEWLAINGWS